MSRAPSEKCTDTTEKDARDPSHPPVDEDPPTLPPVDGDPRRDLISERTLLYRRLHMLQKEIVSFIIYFIDVILIIIEEGKQRKGSARQRRTGWRWTRTG